MSGQKRSLLLLCFLFCASCKKEHPQPPLPDDKVAKIMADLAIAEAATLGMVGFEKDTTVLRYSEQVFEMHEVSKNEYIASMYQISLNLERMESVMLAADSLIALQMKK